MNRRSFLTTLGLSAPALAFPFGRLFQGTSERYRPVKIVRVSSTAYSLPIPPSGYTSNERAGTKREWGRLSRITPHRPERVLEYIVVKIVSDSGIVGFGEATPDIGFFGETLSARTGSPGRCRRVRPRDGRPRPTGSATRPGCAGASPAAAPVLIQSARGS